MAPRGWDHLEAQANHIVRGEALEVGTKVGKSKFETDSGSHKDTIYTIMVQVEKVSTGDEAKEGGKITVLA